MSFKLLTEILDYESNKNNYSPEERHVLESGFKAAYKKITAQNISKSIIKIIDNINNN